MADEISIGSKAIKEIQELKNQLILADNALIKLSQDALQAGKNISTISTPGGLSKSTGDNAQITAQLKAQNDEIARLKSSIVQLNVARQASVSQNINLGKSIGTATVKTRENSIANQIARTEVDRNFRANTLLAGAYARASAQLNILKKEAKDAAINFGENSKQAISAAKAAAEMDSRIRAADSAVGDFQRNVGNYSGGVVSGFQKMYAGARILANILPGIGIAGIFALAIDPIMELIKGTRELESALLSMTSAQEASNRAIENTNINIDHQVKLQKERAKQLGASEKELFQIEVEGQKQKVANAEAERSRIEKDYLAAKEFRDKGVIETENAYLKQARLLEKIIYGEETDSKKRFQIRKNADKKQLDELQNLYQKSAKENNKTKLNAEDELFTELQKNYFKRDELAKREGQRLSEMTLEQNGEKKKKEEDWLKYLYEANRKEIELRLLKQETILAKEFTSYKDQYDALQQANALRLMLIKIDYDEQVRLAKGNANKIKSANLDMQMSIIKNTEDYAVKLKGIRQKENEEYIAEIKSVEKFLEDYHAKQDSQTQASLDVQHKADAAERALYEKKLARLKELQKATRDYLTSFTEEFSNNSGFGETFNTFFKQIEGVDGKMTTMFANLIEGAKTTGEKFAVTFNAVAESVQEVFNFISSTSQRNFDEEKERLQSQYDIALSYAGDNKAAQEKLANDLEIRKREIANREAKAKQKQAIFNIAIDTAQAIVGLYVKPGFPAAIPLAIGVGALGAAQIAMVASQEVPQYWMGGTHDGGLMMVNDGSGSNFQETIVTPDGKVMQPKGRNVLMDAPAGTEIFTQEQWNKELTNMLQGNGISMNASHQYSGITKEDMREVLMESIGNQTQHHSNFDASGASDYIVKRGNVTKRNIARGNGRGIKYKG